MICKNRLRRAFRCCSSNRCCRPLGTSFDRTAFGPSGAFGDFDAIVRLDF
jgi:hypothetical protein